MIMLRSAAIALGLLLSVVAGAAEFSAGSLGSLQLDLQENWKVAAPKSGPVSTIRAGIPGRMTMLVTLLPFKEGISRDARPLVQGTAERIGPMSVEKNLVLRPLDGRQAKGYYFKATDPAPKPDEYRYMYQGAVVVGAALIPFTVLYNDGAEKEAEAALAAIGGAALRAAP
jgi:hypothetical protein